MFIHVAYFLRYKYEMLELFHAVAVGINIIFYMFNIALISYHIIYIQIFSNAINFSTQLSVIHHFVQNNNY